MHKCNQSGGAHGKNQVGWHKNGTAQVPGQCIYLFINKNHWTDNNYSQLLLLSKLFVQCVCTQRLRNGGKIRTPDREGPESICCSGGPERVCVCVCVCLLQILYFHFLCSELTFTVLRVACLSCLKQCWCIVDE